MKEERLDVKALFNFYGALLSALAGSSFEPK